MKWLAYNSTNSGGGWWLKDKDWAALEGAGWTVFWEKTNKHADNEGRWLGALATSAAKQFESARAGIKEFEEITGQDVSDEGCNCCGPPHSFTFGTTKDGSPPKCVYDVEGKHYDCEDFRVVTRRELDEEEPT